MGKFDGWLICSDFDGTLYYKRNIADEDIRAIEYFKSEGGLFTFASGRYADFFDTVSPSVIPNAPIVAMNGALICGEKGENGVRSLLYRGGMDRGAAAEYCFSLFDGDVSVERLVFYSDDGSVEYRRDSEPASREEFMRGIPSILKMGIYVSAEEAVRIHDLVCRTAPENFVVTRSWLRGIELNQVGDSKGIAVLKVKKMTGARHLVCVGDYDNDTEMIRCADVGYAVGNAVDGLKAVADRVTVSAADHAIAAIIAEIGEETDKYGI